MNLKALITELQKVDAEADRIGMESPEVFVNLGPATVNWSIKDLALWPSYKRIEMVICRPEDAPNSSIPRLGPRMDSGQ